MHSEKSVRAPMYAFMAATVFVLLSVGCSSGVGNGNLTAPADGLTDSVETQPDLPSFQDTRDARIADDTDDAAETVDREDATQGQPCDEDSDCPGGECVTLVDGESAFCSNPCTDESDCPEGFDCLLLADSGDDAVQRCVPSDLCIDADGDSFGVGPGCRGRDCDDSSADINPAADEVCDGVDQDCDERVDENPLDERRPCNTGFAGRCDTGTTVCSEGVLNCEPSAEVRGELCDGVDNNCDGGIDEGGVCAGEPCCFSDVCVGSCASARLDDSGVCVAPEGWGEERCDGVDNDCNGEVDEGVTATWWRDGDEDGYGDTLVFVVACFAPAQYVGNDDDCDDTASSANPAGIEVCDTLDNDCDGETDEGVCADLPCCWNETCAGVCADALTSDSGTCVEPPGFGDERCDDLDNDCDGSVDEGYALREPCSEGVGACTTLGVTVCAADGAEVVCDAAAGASSAERCDGVDNDCDGSVDEGFDVGAACASGVGECRRTGVRVCTGDGSAAVCGAVAGAPVAEVCDGRDNDCDSSTDEGNPGGGASCTTGSPGICSAGIRQCSGGGLSCIPTNSPQTEVCDRADNDCDGATDEGFNVGGSCTVGVGACVRTGLWVCNAAQTGRVCSASPGTSQPEICGNGIDEDCNGSDLACPSACSGVTRNRVWVDTETVGYNDGFVPQIADLFEGGGRTVTRSQFLFASQLSNYDVIIIDGSSLASSLNATTVQNWIRAGGALFLANENPTVSQCNYFNSLVSGSGLSFSCSLSDVQSSAIDNKLNLLSGVAGNIVNVGSWLSVFGGGNAARLAGPDSSIMVGRYATSGCGSVVLWGDVEYGHTGYYTGNSAVVWGLLRNWLLTIP